jgi:hypothetical protein
MRKITIISILLLCGLAAMERADRAVAIENGKATDVAPLVERIRSNSVERERGYLANQLRDLVLGMDSQGCSML